MKENYELNKVTKISSIKEMLDLSKKEAGDKIAFQYKDEENKDNIVKVTYKEFNDDVDEIRNGISKI